MNGNWRNHFKSIKVLNLNYFDNILCNRVRQVFIGRNTFSLFYIYFKFVFHQFHSSIFKNIFTSDQSTFQVYKLTNQYLEYYFNIFHVEYSPKKPSKE